MTIISVSRMRILVMGKVFRDKIQKHFPEMNLKTKGTKNIPGNKTTSRLFLRLLTLKKKQHVIGISLVVQ